MYFATQITGGLIELKILIASAIFGVLLPDIEEEESFTGKRLWFISWALKAIGVKHRGITHSLFFVALFAFGAFYYEREFYRFILLGISIGVCMHVIGDTPTNNGVALFSPFYSKRVQIVPAILRFKTNGIFENLVVFPSLLALNIFLVYKVFI